MHSREAEIFEEEIQQRELNGERQQRTVRYKIFEPDTYYTRRDVKHAGFCTRLENNVFVCTSVLDPAFPRDGMCQEHMAVWRAERDGHYANNSANNNTKEQEKESSEPQDNNILVVPTGPTYASIAVKAEEEEKTKKQLKKQAKAEAKAAAAAAKAAAEAESHQEEQNVLSPQPQPEDEWQEVGGKKNKKN
mgnify:CR=1 FL=1